MRNLANLIYMRLPALFSNAKLIVISILLAACYLLLVSSAHAQSTYTNTDQEDHAKVQKTLYGLLSATTCMLSGIDPINPSGCLRYNSTSQTYGYATQTESPKVGGLLGFATTSMGQLYLIPISTHSYVDYVASNFGISPKAYAQNDGFVQLNGILQIWTIFRNLAYLFFVLIFVIIGMGVMLRLKIDPRTVMSIQNQIPKLIVGLVLITFSYAIAGFMVDLMWTTTYLTIRIAGQVKLPPPTDQMPSPWNKDRTNIDQAEVTNSLLSSPIGFGNTVLGRNEGLGLAGFAGSISGTIGTLAAGFLTPLGGSRNEECTITGSPISFITGPIGWLIMDQFDGKDKSFAACIRGVIYYTIDVLVQSLVFLIVLFAIIIALFRIWWQLIKSFAYIIIYTCIAPIYIAAGLIPGSTVGFGAWIRGLIANLAVYPATVAFFLGAYIFLASFNKTSFQPPLTGNPAANDGFGYIAAFAILMITPELINMLRDALKSPPNKYIAPSIQRGFGAGAMLPGAVARGTWGKLWKHDPYGKAIGPLNSALSDYFYGRIGGFQTPNRPSNPTSGDPKSRTKRIVGRIGSLIFSKPGTH